MLSRTARERTGVAFCLLAGAAFIAHPASLVAQPANNACANAIPITDGATPFSTIGATTDGPSHSGSCQFDGQTYNDIWFTYTASCTGELTVSTCGTAQYDSDLVVYNGCNCGSLITDFLDCNDDASGCSNFTSVVTVPVITGNCYFIRVGGFNAGDSGTGTLNLTCVDQSTTPGACCHGDDSCTMELIAVCAQLGGEFHGVNRPCTPNPCAQSVGPDVVYSDAASITNWGAVGGIRAYSLSSNTCNIGTTNLPWGATSPLLAMNAYRIYDGRIEQIGMSWVKNGTGAAAGPGCGYPCNGAGGSVLGSGCLDVYGSGFNGSWSILGPRSAVNSFSGAYPGPSGNGINAISKRLQIHESDLNSANFPNARYLVEGVYVAAADASAGNALNNASYKLVNVSGLSFDLSPFGDMNIGIPAIYAWKFDGMGSGVPDPDVSVVIADVPGEGRFFVGHKATDLGAAGWRYDYAVYNLNSHRSGGSLSVPVPDTTAIRNVGFHDVDYHSGEPLDNTDWNTTIDAGFVTWSSPQTFAQNPNTNALRWGTMYNFWFETDAPPSPGTVTLGLFRTGSPDQITAGAMVPSVCKADCLADNTRNGMDIYGFVDCFVGENPNCGCADIDNNGFVDLNDIEPFVLLILEGLPCP
ncbi:MAG: hypothetical protein KF841_17195 [Phycisphaerae bacterium]|nr:hypothetical protein [Phycisphaerae bacterium]